MTPAAGKNIALFLLICLWLIFALLGLFYVSKSSQKPFDPAGILYYAANQPDFDSQVSKMFHAALTKSLNNVVVHITSHSDCLCQLAATRHIQAIKERVEHIGKTNVTAYIENIDGLTGILTSTPAIAVFNELGQLSYLGPYSTGIGCLSGKGTVEPYLAKQRAPGAIIPLDSTGCYCHI